MRDIACSPQEVGTFFWFEELADVAERLVETIECPGANTPEMRLELGEGHLDGIEIRRIGRQVQKPATVPLQGLRGSLALVGRQIVEDDHGSRLKGGCELGLDVGVEGDPVHRAMDDPGRNQGVMGQPCDEGLRAPLAKRRGPVKPFADRCPSAQPGQVGLDRRFVDEDQAMGFATHARLAAIDPLVSLPAQCRPPTFLCDKPFFYMRTRPVAGHGGSTRAEPADRRCLPARCRARPV